MLADRPERRQYPVGENNAEQLTDHDPGDESDIDAAPLELSSYQADALQIYIWHLRDMLGLHHWDVFLATMTAREGARASIHPVVGRRVAALRVSQGWFETSAWDRRNDILHELIHLHHNDMTEVWRLGLGASGALNQRLWNALYTLFVQEAELMTDQLATHLAPLFPLMENVPEVAEQLAWHEERKSAE